MLVTKNAAEFCTLLVDEIYGELPSRIFSALVTKGRSSLAQLVHHTALTPRQLRHGLAVLLQHNLLFFYVDATAKTAFYEANADHAYNLIRTGKILEMVETSFGPPAKDVMQNLLSLGQTRISDLTVAYQAKINQRVRLALEKDSAAHGEDGPNGVNGTFSQVVKGLDLPVKSSSELNSVLCRLVEADLVEVVHSKTFQTMDDTLYEVEKEVTALFPGGVKGTKGKMDFDEKVAARLAAIREESKTLKRKLESDGMCRPSAPKRRKLFNGVGAGPGGVQGDGIHENHKEEPDITLDPSQVVRVNYERCNVDLRNRRLVQFAMDMYGETTAYVYGILLRQLTEGLPRCRDDSRMHVRVVDDIPEGPRFVTTGEVFEHIKPSVDLSSGLGKCHSRAINTRAAEKIRRYCPAGNSLPAEAEDDGAASEDEDGGDESGESDDDENAESDNKEADDEPHVNGTREGRVKFAASTGKEPPRLDRTSQLRQHLLLLAQSKQGFVRHCGTQEWTVDFEHLLHQLKEAELDSIIEQTCGRFGLRLVHILRSKGKLDEKTLHNLGLMKKPDVQRKMLEMEVHGFVHVQEVPKDSKHDVKKSIFLWFCDVEKTLGLLLQNTYKTMLRCMQTLALLQQRDQDVLMLTKRSNVKGREQDVMRKEYFDRYSMFLTKERRLLAQVHRLDELVGVLRDY